MGSPTIYSEIWVVFHLLKRHVSQLDDYTENHNVKLDTWSIQFYGVEMYCALARNGEEACYA